MRRASGRERKVWPEDAVRKIREMRALGATWKVIAVPFDTDWTTVRNFFLSACAKREKIKPTANDRLRKLLRIIEGHAV